MYLFILATICCLVDLFALVIIKFITTCCFSESSDDQQIRKDLIALKKEMSSISMVDEFARYAKLQRKFNKLQDEAKKKMNTRSVSKMKLQWLMTGGIRILNGIFASTLLFMYRSEPVMVFPSGTLWPLEPFLSWPTGVDSCISLPLWMLFMRSSISCCYGISAS